MWIPPLPVKAGGRSVYPCGTFSGTWPIPELRYAESVGVRILEVTEGLFWPRVQNLFREWVRKLWDLRFNAEGGKSGPFGTFLKFYMNSLTGKLGMRPGSDSYVLNPELGHAKGNRYECVSEDPEIYKVKGPQGRWRGTEYLAGQACSHVEWAAYITAAGRIEWHRQATAGSGLDLVAGDTDSVFTTTERTLSVGEALGEWQDKGRWIDGDWIAPKFYKYTPLGVHAGDAEVNGGAKFRSKGVRASRPSEWWDLWNRGRHEFEWTSNMGFRLAAKAGTLFEETTIKREITRNTGDRILRADGLTYPPNARDLGLS
jgi:hypothetical protein